jgi:hypothetical protein
VSAPVLLDAEEPHPMLFVALAVACAFLVVLSRLPKVISHRRRKSLENKAFSEKSLSLIVS